VMWYLFVNANINLVNAETDFVSNQIQFAQHF
jgi:translation elongation factor EF-Ts